MIAYYIDKFIKKLQIQNYPLKGFWIQLSTEDLNIVNNEIDNNEFRNYSLSYNITPVNTTIFDDRFQISFNTENINLSNKIKSIRLYAVDLLEFDGINSFKDRDILEQLSIIIHSSNGIEFSPVTVFDIYFPTNFELKCSFQLSSSIENNVVDHYNSNLVGQQNFYQSNESSLLELNSSKSRLREVMTIVKPIELGNNLSIKKSGIIQL